MLFAEKDGTRSVSQITAFEDTWEWNIDARARLPGGRGAGRPGGGGHAGVPHLPGQQRHDGLSRHDGPAPIELRRVLKVTGSIYLHCDPTASHYLKILMDAVFGPQNFRNEIIWKRTSAHAKQRRNLGPISRLDFVLRGFGRDEMDWSHHSPTNKKYVEARFRTGEERPWKDTEHHGIEDAPTARQAFPWRGFQPD